MRKHAASDTTMRQVIRSMFFCALAVTAADAAVVEGVVLDEETGYPLARAQVNLLPIAGTGGAAVTLHSGDRGSFTILSVKAGWYVLRITRAGFAPTEAGQMRAGRPGTPFEVTSEDRASFFQIRMRRLPAVTGTVLDENGIGIADWPVHIYSARRPVRRIAETKTDDRGNYRIGALDPGSYVVRSGAGTLDDDYSVLPTYYKFGTALENSEAVHLRLGETQPDVAIHPVRGKLITVSGIFSVPADRSGRLTLITDTGRRVIATASGPYNTTVSFEASGIAPGVIELLADGVDCGSYSRLVVDRDSQRIRMNCTPLQRARVEWMTDGNHNNSLRFPLLMRRVDLDGVGPVRAFRQEEPILPGHWEMTVQTGPLNYLASMRSSADQRAAVADDGWFGMDVSNYSVLMVELSSKPATVNGTVVANTRPVTGAVVYLEAYNPETQNSRIQLWSTRTDAQGGYTFQGLRPGYYRAISTFDFDPDDRFLMDRASAVKLGEAEQATQRIELILP